jgi:CRP/FNR family cyclic AMP-dependent transcriptional regulator
MGPGSEIKGESLAGVELFADLDLDARKAIAKQCHEARFAAGDVIMSHKDTGRDVFLILNGIVEVDVFSLDGRRTTFTEKGPGEIIGELAAIDGRPRSAHVIAKTDCWMATIAPDQFLKVLDTYPAVSRRIRSYLTEKVRVLSERVFEFNALCVNNRIHVELLRCARSMTEEGPRISISPAPTHAEIASRVSTHREAVSRELSRLQKDGLLEKVKDALVVTDVKMLESLVEQSLGDVPAIC